VRGGKETAYWWGKDLVKGMANCDGCGGYWYKTAPVGSFKPNPFGLYDTAGNVKEWVQDCWHEGYTGAPADGSAWGWKDGGYCGHRVFRGGSWYDDPVDLRSSERYRTTVDHRSQTVGFRLAKDIY
jgi:formylglycine-generating enzyme required for sulfatase activity